MTEEQPKAYLDAIRELVEQVDKSGKTASGSYWDKASSCRIVVTVTRHSFFDLD